MAHDKGSFDYKVVNENISKLLDARSELDNTIQVSMPFVRATTTIELPELGKGNIGFTLGLHAIDEDVRYEDMYASVDGEMPLIGYTYTVDGKPKRVYATDPNSEIISGLFDKYGMLYKTTNFIRIPPPGITKVTVSRAKNGTLAMATMEISVPSLVQLENLHRTFLIPGVGMILEWGQQFTPELNPSLGELPDISANLFPWRDRTKLMKILNKLAISQLGLEEILKDYVYPTQGQYMWMFGRVANFSTKSNSDGSFNCTVKIVGPSEDSFAYSTQNTIIPSKDSSTANFCATDTNSVESYFTETTEGTNLKTLLDKTLKGGPWKQHVQILVGGNKKGGDPAATEQSPVISQNDFADAENAYFMTWRFFVNVVLNSTDENYKGLKYLFSTIMSQDELKKIGLLLPYATGDDRTNTQVENLKYINDPMESYVGMNKFLRSVDPSTLIIVNEKAAQLAEANDQYNIPTSKVKFFEPTTEALLFKDRGLFEESTKADELAEDRGFLSSGVWLNHKAVAECMLGSTTILRGIVSLLERMNHATKNYWKLVIDTAEPMEGSEHSFNYMVVDANFRESSDRSVSKFIDKVHTFNKYVRTDSTTGKLIGSELTECSIDLSLPKRLFTQIATLGLVQPEDMQKISDAGKTKDELAEEAAAAAKTGIGPTKPPKISDPNDTLREMFAITSLAGVDTDGNFNDNIQGPDITILPKTARAEQLKAAGICGKANTQTTANTGGVGQKPGGIDPSINLNGKSADELKKAQEEALKITETDVCKKCAPCNQSKTTAIATGNTNSYITNTPWSAGFISYVMQESGTSFPSAGQHTAYAQALRTNSRGWTVLNPATTELKVGDVIIENRNNNTLSFKSSTWSGPSHADVVTSVSDSRITAVGGNVSDSVTSASPAVTNGILSGKEYFTVLRPPAAQVTRIVQVANVELKKWQSAAWKETTPAALDTVTSYYVAGKLSAPPKTVNQKPPVSGSNVCNDDKYAEVGTIGYKGTLGADSVRSARPALIADGKVICADCAKASAILAQSKVVIAAQDKATKAAEQVTRDFPGMNRVFRYVEIFPDYMVAEIADSANGQFANAFGASPGALSISGDIGMPGIAGLRIGELFWIDRIPTFYKAFGAFQIMGIEDSIGRDGWTTKVHSTFNYLGTNWKEAMAVKLSSAKAAQAPSITAPVGT